MQQSGPNGDPISSERQPTSRSMGARRVDSGAAVALAALLGIVAASVVGCEGNDSTEFPAQGGASGSGAGRSGAGGTTGGSSGRGGASGASGMGGAIAGAGGATGGSSGNGGTSAGTGGADDGDAGPPDSGSPDAAPVLSEREITAQTICATGDSLDGCDSDPQCFETQLGFYSGYLADKPQCFDEADAYFECQAAQPITAYECSATVPSSAQFVAGTPACADEEAAFFGIFEKTPNCD